METEPKTTQECIDYCIKYLEENPNEQFASIEGTNIGEEMILVYRGGLCGCDTNKEPFYEVRVSTLTKIGYQDKKGYVDNFIVSVKEA